MKGGGCIRVFRVQSPESPGNDASERSLCRAMQQSPTLHAMLERAEMPETWQCQSAGERKFLMLSKFHEASMAGIGRKKRIVLTVIGSRRATSRNKHQSGISSPPRRPIVDENPHPPSPSRQGKARKRRSMWEELSKRHLPSWLMGICRRHASHPRRFACPEVSGVGFRAGSSRSRCCSSGLSMIFVVVAIGVCETCCASRSH